MEQRAAAEGAVAAMEDALALAGLPPLAALAAGRVTVTPAGVHVELGGCSTATLLAIAHYLADHARCTDRVPPWMAQLPSLRGEVSS